MPDSVSRGRNALLVRTENRVCALPLSKTIETLRPLPIEAVHGAPPFVLGISIVRGMPTPVVDLGGLLGLPSQRPEHWVTIRVADKQLALAVDAVLDVYDLSGLPESDALPCLLERASMEFVETIAMLNRDVLFVLRDAFELPEEIWRAVSLQEAQT